MSNILFKTIHGSHLYGLANENSDVDYYTVVSKVQRARIRYSKQSIVDGIDTSTVDFGTWMIYCQKGVPQALEAMFSQKAVYDEIAEFRASFVVGQAVTDTYFRTIKSFALAEGFKSKRHALRLALNLNELARTGRFDPTLTTEDIAYINSMARKGNEDVYGLAKCIAW